MLTNLVLSKPHTGASMLEKDQGVQKISPCYLISTNIPEKEGQGTQLVKDKTSGKVCQCLTSKVPYFNPCGFGKPGTYVQCISTIYDTYVSLNIKEKEKQQERHFTFDLFRGHV